MSRARETEIRPSTCESWSPLNTHSLTHTLTHTHSHSHSLTLTHTHTLTLTHTHVHVHMNIVLVIDSLLFFSLSTGVIITVVTDLTVTDPTSLDVRIPVHCTLYSIYMSSMDRYVYGFFALPPPPSPSLSLQTDEQEQIQV